MIRKVLQAEIARACAPLQARVNELERDLAVERRELSRWRGIAAEAERMRDQERGNRIRAEREAAAFAERLSQKSGRPAKKKP